VTAIRDATPEDGAACAAVYAPYVTDTATTFEYEPPTPAEMAERIAKAQKDHAWVVAEDDGRVMGYAYAGRYKERAAYRWACEVSVYLEQGRRRNGMTLPNPASEGMHRALGFEPVGVYRRIGWKHGAWHDVAWVQRPLGAAGTPPSGPC
jgi:L-amino acid N-acyltransferase YncA